MRKVHSFSTKRREDTEFMEKLKRQIDLRGGNFSYEVVQALKARFPDLSKGD